jgi:hypothetical protein
MNNRKNYNSIVFLTTLSVYLGLVLAGGAVPSVLAQAATTRGFDIKNEIVVEDDLDKKPDEETFSELKSKFDQSDTQFIEQYAKTILALVRLSEINGYELTVDSSDKFAKNDELLSKLFPTLKKDVAINGFHYSLNRNKFSGKLNLKSKFESDISPVNNSFNSSLVSLRYESQNEPEKVISENTKITFENNQVFIVTRLPRGSIDSLLAQNDAQ